MSVEQKNEPLVIDEIPDEHLRIRIGKRGNDLGNKAETLKYYLPTGEPTYKRALGWAKHIYDPSLNGAEPPRDGFEDKSDDKSYKEKYKTSDDVVELYKYYRDLINQMDKEIDKKCQERGYTKDIAAGSSSSQIAKHGNSIVDELNAEIENLKREKEDAKKEYEEKIKKMKEDCEEEKRKIRQELEEEIERLKKEIEGFKNKVKSQFREVFEKIGRTEWYTKYVESQEDIDTILLEIKLNILSHILQQDSNWEGKSSLLLSVDGDPEELSDVVDSTINVKIIARAIIRAAQEQSDPTQIAQFIQLFRHLNSYIEKYQSSYDSLEKEMRQKHEALDGLDKELEKIVKDVTDRGRPPSSSSSSITAGSNALAGELADILDIDISKDVKVKIEEIMRERTSLLEQIEVLIQRFNELSTINYNLNIKIEQKDIENEDLRGEISRLNEQLRAMNERFGEIQRRTELRVVELNEQIIVLQQEKGELLDRLDRLQEEERGKGEAKDDEIGELTREIEIRNKSIEELNIKIRRIGDERDNANTKNDDTRRTLLAERRACGEELDRLNGVLATLRENIARLTEERDAAIAERDDANREVERLRGELDGLRGELRRLTIELNKLEGENKGKDDEKIRLKGEIKIIQERISALVIQIRNANRRAEAAEKNAADATERAEAVERNAADAERRAADANDRAGAAEKSAADATKNLSDGSDANRALQRELESLRQQLEDNRRRYETTIDELRRQLEEKNRENSELSKENDELRRQLGEMTNNNDALQRENDEKSEQIIQLENQIRVLRIEIREKTSEFEMRLAHMQKKFHDEMEENKGRHTDRIGDLSNQIATAEEELRTLKELQESSKGRTETIERLNREKYVLETKLRECQEELKRKRQENLEAERSRYELTLQLEKLTKENEEHRLENQRLNTIIEQLNMRIHSIGLENVNSKTRSRELERQMAELGEERGIIQRQRDILLNKMIAILRAMSSAFESSRSDSNIAGEITSINEALAKYDNGEYDINSLIRFIESNGSLEDHFGSTIPKIKLRLEKSNRELEALQRQLLELQRENAIIQQQYEACQAELARCHSELERCHAELASLREQYDKLLEYLAQLEARNQSLERENEELKRQTSDSSGSGSSGSSKRKERRKSVVNGVYASPKQEVVEEPVVEGGVNPRHLNIIAYIIHLQMRSKTSMYDSNAKADEPRIAYQPFWDAYTSIAEEGYLLRSDDDGDWFSRQELPGNMGCVAQLTSSMDTKVRSVLIELKKWLNGEKLKVSGTSCRNKTASDRMQQIKNRFIIYLQQSGARLSFWSETPTSRNNDVLMAPLGIYDYETGNLGGDSVGAELTRDTDNLILALKNIVPPRQPQSVIGLQEFNGWIDGLKRLREEAKVGENSLNKFKDAGGWILDFILAYINSKRDADHAYYIMDTIRTILFFATALILRFNAYVKITMDTHADDIVPLLVLQNNEYGSRINVTFGDLAITGQNGVVKITFFQILNEMVRVLLNDRIKSKIFRKYFQGGKFDRNILRSVTISDIVDFISGTTQIIGTPLDWRVVKGDTRALLSGRKKPRRAAKKGYTGHHFTIPRIEGCLAFEFPSGSGSGQKNSYGGNKKNKRKNKTKKKRKSRKRNFKNIMFEKC